MPSIEQLQKLLTLDPNDAFVLYGLAQEYAKAGDHAQAVGLYDRCLTADPSYCYAYFHKARSLEASGRLDEAAGALRRGLEAARKASDRHAAAEIETYLDSLPPAGS